MFKKIILLAVFLTALATNCLAEKRQIALTIDDLPFVGEGANFHLNMIIDAINASEIPATGFVIAGKVRPENWETLHRFEEAGLGIGNHTFTHINLDKVDVDAYIREIDEADKLLSPVLTEPKYFRYPYLAMSQGNKKNKVLNFLISRNYHIAPVTIDSKDFIFNQLLLSVQENQRRIFLETLKPCYLNFIWQQTLKAEQANHIRKNNQPQVLLIHANLLNAYVLPDIIKLYKQNDFTFISLQEGLKTPSTRLSPTMKRQHENLDDFVVWD